MRHPTKVVGIARVLTDGELARGVDTGAKDDAAFGNVGIADGSAQAERIVFIVVLAPFLRVVGCRLPMAR